MRVIVLDEEALSRGCDLYEAHKEKCGGFPLKKRPPRGSGPGCRLREIDWKEFERRPCTCGLKEFLA